MTDANGRPDYPQNPTTDARVIEKADQLTKRLALIQEQEAAELARFVTPPKAAKATKSK
jgi:hypothetical protein